MKDKERDIFDDLCRSKLQDFEADTMPGDWEAIADRLTVKKSVPFRRQERCRCGHGGASGGYHSGGIVR